MAMSKDRVRFTIPSGRLDGFSEDGVNYRKLVSQCFGITLESRGYHQDVEVTCRPSQFARFIVLRNQMGLENMIKELKAELVSAEPYVAPVVKFDASSNPNIVKAA